MDGSISASSAILEALRLVPGLMRHLAVLAVIPRPIRDGVCLRNRASSEAASGADALPRAHPGRASWIRRMTPLVSTRVTILLAVCLFTPFALRTLSTRLEPYPAVLLPAGASRVRLNQSEVSFSRTTLTCRGRDGNWQPLDVTRLLSPIPPWSFHDIVSNEFGLKSTPLPKASRCNGCRKSSHCPATPPATRRSKPRGDGSRCAWRQPRTASQRFGSQWNERRSAFPRVTSNSTRLCTRACSGWSNRACAWFWNRVAISSRTPSTGLRGIRIAAGLFFLVWYMPVRRWVGEASPAFFNPPPISPARFFLGFPPEAVMVAADVVAVALACLIVVGGKARSCTIALTVFDIAGNVFVYALGEIDHDILLYSFLGCMAFSGWGGQLAWLPDRPHRSDAPERSLALLAVCIAFAMFSAGFEKAIFWVDLDLQAGGFLSWFYTGYFDLDRRHLLASWVLHPATLAFRAGRPALAVVFELGALPALLIGPLAWRAWLLGACLFHLTSTLLLNISFDAHFLPLIAFVDFSRVQAALQKLGRQQLARSSGLLP